MHIRFSILLISLHFNIHVYRILHFNKHDIHDFSTFWMLHLKMCEIYSWYMYMFCTKTKHSVAWCLNRSYLMQNSNKNYKVVVQVHSFLLKSNIALYYIKITLSYRASIFQIFIRVYMCYVFALYIISYKYILFFILIIFYIRLNPK